MVKHLIVAQSTVRENKVSSRVCSMYLVDFFDNSVNVSSGSWTILQRQKCPLKIPYLQNKGFFGTKFFTELYAY